MAPTFADPPALVTPYKFPSLPAMRPDAIPFDMGYGNTYITEITDDNVLVGYAQDFGEGSNFGFIWDGVTKTLH
jgi:hypothetical protein